MAAAKKKERKMSHSIEVLREIYTLKDTEKRLRGIARGLGIAEGIRQPEFTALRDAGAGVATAGRHLQRLAARISRTTVDLAAVRDAMGESTTTPEDTLLEAGISTKCQTQYQRRMSSLLAGRE